MAVIAATRKAGTGHTATREHRSAADKSANGNQPSLTGHFRTVAERNQPVIVRIRWSTPKFSRLTDAKLLARRRELIVQHGAPCQR